MDIDFSLVLLSLVSVTGVVWLFDYLFLLSSRKQAVSEFPTASGPFGEQLDSGQKLDFESLLALDTDQMGINESERNAVHALAREPLLVEYAKSFFPVLFIVLILRSFLFEPFTIPSSSMVPTLEIGDYILVNKFTYGLRLPVIGTKIFDNNDPERGDVMVFKFPTNPKINYIKRVVGVPGDHIRYQGKTLYVNGEKVETEFVAKVPPGSPNRTIYNETLGDVTHTMQHLTARNHNLLEFPGGTIPEGHYFVMGDNRDNSNDSRAWGTVEDKYVVGNAFAIWMNKKPGLNVPSFGRNGTID
ncbi:MAG: signal peptidase I [Gammaproteobacteria bacterium]|nr:MAG: signal peptidase I [Gammaproteobacteria bacterium]